MIDFDANGAPQIQRMPEGMKFRTAMIHPAPEGADAERDVVFIREGEPEEGHVQSFSVGTDDGPMSIEAEAAAEGEVSKGGAHKKVLFHGREGGQGEGTFSLEVHRPDASAEH